MSRYTPPTRNRRFKEIDDETHSLFRGIINKRKLAMEAGVAA